MTIKIIGYLRVSTDRQKRSGLGLEAQQEAVKGYAASVNGVIIKTYSEAETGKRSDRPQLASALAHARREGAILVVAKLDRLSRNVAFLSALMESAVPFVACDIPQATPLTLHILAAVAQEELRAISQRTIAALAALKRRGVRLGKPENLTANHRAKGTMESAKARKALATDAYADLLPIMTQLHRQGRSLAQIAANLNEQGYTSRTGAKFCPVKVKRVIDRASAV